MICTSCGTELPPEARFCRQCGRPIPMQDSRSVLEAETRTLGTAGRNITGNFNVNPTGAAYLAPDHVELGHLHAADITSSPSHTKRNVLIGAAGTILAMVAIMMIVGIVFVRSRLRHSPLAGMPGAPGLPRIIPPIPKVPTVPPAVAPPDEGAAVDTSLIYPGAETVVQTTLGGGGDMLQLRSHDSFDKVVNWYVAKLKGGKVVKSLAQNAVIKSDTALAIISASGNDTQILLKRETDEDDEPL